MDFRLLRFLQNKEAQKDSFCTAQEMAALFQEEIKKNSQDIAQVFTYKDIEENEKNGKISALLSLEEGAIYQREPEMLRKFYEQGVRMATFTWNYENDLGYPNRFIILWNKRCGVQEKQQV